MDSDFARTSGQAAAFDDTPGWARARADRMGVMIDSAAYFRAALDALDQAKRSVWLIGWTFDPRTELDPRDTERDTRIGTVLKTLANERPELDIRILVWNAGGLAHLARRFQPALARGWFSGSNVHFATDSTLSFGAAMHRKLLVVDDSLAFCPNDDIAVNRWDDPHHLDHNKLRRLPSGRPGPPWHANHVVLDGDAAARLGDVARAGWYHATGEGVTGEDERRTDLWPEGLSPLLTDTEVTLTGTDPSGEIGDPQAGLEHALAAIRAARRTIYAETTYLTAPPLREALAERLQEPNGPEVVLITGRHAPSFFDRAVMDPPRNLFLHRLTEADVHDRLSLLSPRTEKGKMIRVHAKLLIIDDRLIRVGSFNFANRSSGYDPECDVVAEAEDEAPLRDLRHRLIAHFLGLEAEQVARAERATGSIGTAIRQLDANEHRLPPIVPHPPLWRGWLARMHLGDPEGERDAWRPWKRAG